MPWMETCAVEQRIAFIRDVLRGARCDTNFLAARGKDGRGLIRGSVSADRDLASVELLANESEVYGYDRLNEFGLDEKKRGYVKWYRNHLKKQGQNPPEAKVAK